MIIGIGTDLCDIRRIEKTLARFGERFTNRIYSHSERSAIDVRYSRAAGYALRYAAKEACVKALGTGVRRAIGWRDMEVLGLPSGKPVLRLTGGALKRLNDLTPPKMKGCIDLSLTDEYPLAQAVVIIWSVPDQQNHI